MLDIRQRTGYLFLSVMLGHVILISAQVPNRHGVKVLEAVTFGVFSEVQRRTSAAVGGVQRFWGDYVALRGVKQENEALRHQLADLQVRLQEQRALAKETATLQELLDLRTRVSLPTLAASVIAGDPTPGLLTMWIDKGAAQGVTNDLAVIAPEGVVGRTFLETAPNAARVQLLTGRNAAAGALIERTRVSGIVMGGEQDPPLRMDFVSNHADVQVGDLVVTSGLDGIYPKGLAIGTVESTEPGPGLYKIIRVRPAVDFAALEAVLVVTAPPPKAEAGDAQ